MNRFPLLLLALAATAFSGCCSEQPAAAQGHHQQANAKLCCGGSETHHSSVATGEESCPHKGAGEEQAAKSCPHKNSSGTSQSALNRLDKRTPVPVTPPMAMHMKADMKDHLLVVQEITLALAGGDFEAVEQSANRIALSDALATRCDHMGAGAPGFSELGLEFHRKGSSIVAAARAEDPEGVLSALGETIEVCTSCHERFRQDVVDTATWEERTAASAPHAH